MPICKREGFENTLSAGKDDIFNDNEEVFYCEVTKEIFRNYEDYFRHVMVINSTVWQCEASGRENLTYVEALKSERRARKKMEAFKNSLKAPVMLVIEHSKQSSLNTLCVIISKFLRRRFFLQEEVTACQKTTYNAYTVVEIMPPPPDKLASPNIAYEEVEKLIYKLRRIGPTQTEIIVPFENIRRQRSELTVESLHMFVKNNVIRVEGLLRPKPESYKKYVTDPKITFSTIFVGKMPHFTPAKIKNHQQANGKKQSTINNYLIKCGDEKNGKLSVEELAKREREKVERAEAKAKSLKEEMERLRREKQEKIAELERQKLEKRAKLMAKIDAECTALLTKTDDLERTDQHMLPVYTPVQTYIPTTLLGDAFEVREFMHSFMSMLSGIEVFRGNISFYEMSRAFTTREVAGPLSDILLVFLRTIFDLQKEEEEECPVNFVTVRRELLKSEPFITMSQAARSHLFSQRHYSTKINRLPLDALTLSEVLRLHLLASGASVEDRTKSWRVMYRNGYTSSEDPGFALRMRHPHILRTLKMHTIYQLPFVDTVRVMRCLMAQILTYSSPINVIEERMDEMAKARSSLRSLASTENMRLSSMQTQKRTLTNEYNQQCAENYVKNDPDKKRQLEDKLNKKVAELLAQSERDRKKYEQEVEKLQAALFNFLIYLGVDRAYRKYYVLESIPGIFIEHPRDCMDTCLVNPPKNVPLHELNAKLSNLPKTRKDLRAHLLKMYTDEEKKAVKAEKLLSNKGTTSQENKENQENKVLNGLSNGLDHKVENESEVKCKEGMEKVEVDGRNIEPIVLSPTQYQLYMCTGDHHNCIVHDEHNTDRQNWAYLHEKEDIEILINSLNPLGERESQLREQLNVLRDFILNHVKKCPVELLSVDSEQRSTFKNRMMVETHRKYHKANFGCTNAADLSEVMQIVLTDRILQLENDIYSGDLGRLKVEDMNKWRQDLQNKTYHSQSKVQWGTTQKGTTAPGDVESDVFEEMDEEDLDGENKVAGYAVYSYKPYRDPGEELGDTTQIHMDNSEDDETLLQDSSTSLVSVKNLASALLQVEQSIERRFLKEPFGAPLKETKDKDRKLRLGADHLKQWEISLMECTSFSQVFLHLNILHDSIVWARSTNKSLCQVCRRGSDPDKMLLCDECNGGMHMFCMKPKMKTIPEGDWYCKRCVQRLGLENESVALKQRNEHNARERKRLRDNDIEDVLEEQQSAKEEEVDDLENIGEEEEENFESDDSDDDSKSHVKSTSREETDGDSEENEDILACAVCSYDGSEVICVRCKNAFHLECIKLKRQPLYIFVCPMCKSKEEQKKRKFDGNDECVDKDDETASPGPATKRLRPQRSSLRNSLPDDAAQDQTKTNNQRRSNRRTGDYLPLNSSLLYKLLDDIMKHEQAWPFLRPVLQSEVPDYYKIIKKPMDFAKVKSKLNMGDYQLNEEVMNDIQLVFSNCDKYNVKGNEIYQAGFTLEKYIIDRCKELNLPFKPSDMNE